MKNLRNKLKTIVNEIAKEYEKKSFDNLSKLKFPIHLENQKFGKLKVWIEFNLLELNEKYIHIAISASAGGFTDFYPVSTSFIVNRK